MEGTYHIGDQRRLRRAKYGSRRRVRPKIRRLAPLDAVHARLKNEFTEDEKYHNLMRWLICVTIKLLKIWAPEKFAEVTLKLNKEVLP